MQGTHTNATDVTGALWALSPFDGKGEEEVTEFKYMLIAASLDRDAGL
jgi:hypothetical protein